MTISSQNIPKVVAGIAMTTWALSLPLAGIVLYAGQRKLPGFEILAMGWLSPLVLNFAWFANVFFLYGITRLLRGGAPIASSAFAAFLSLDAIRFNQFMLNEGGASTPVYGYGWGTVLWFLSIALLLVATGLSCRYASARDEEHNEVATPYIVVGSLLALITLVVSVAFATYDRKLANAPEQERLQGIAFKRGPVCSIEEPVPEMVLSLAGPLELVSDTGAYPFNSPITLMDWGIPAVRAKGLDYFLIRGKHSDGIKATASTGPVSVRLEASRTSAPDYIGATFQTSLTSTDGKTIGFFQAWRPEPHGARYCPERSSFPGPTDQPRKLLMSALGITNPVSARLEAIGDSATQEESLLLESRIVAQFSVPERVRLENRGCPEGTGYRGVRLEKYPDTWDLGVPFISDGIYFFAGKNRFKNAFCADGNVYVYATKRRGAEFTLTVQKRSLTTFAEDWTAKIKLHEQNQALEESRTKILALREGGTAITVDLLHDTNNTGVSLEAVLRE